MKLGKKILSLVMIVILTVSMIPGMSFEALADEPLQAADYSLVLCAEDGTGKVYKNSLSETNEIDMPQGLSYANGVWTMDGFSFETTADAGIYILGDDAVTLKLAPGSENSITAAGTGSYVYGIYSEKALTVNGSGTLNVSAEGAQSDTSYTYGVCSYDGFTMNGGTVNVLADKAKYYIYSFYTGEDFEINGGIMNLTAGENSGYGGYGLCVSGNLYVNGGELNATGLGEYCYGAYVYYLHIPYNGTVNFSGTYGDQYFRSIVGEGIERSEKSDYMSYSGLYDPAVAEEYGLESAINVQGFYNNNWIKTTYANQGYHLSTSGLENAKVIPDAELVYGGHYVLLSYKVKAEEAVSDGKIGIWTDVQIGDNDYAPINVIKDEDTGSVVGFELIDNHDENYGCYNLNAKYMCYFDGYMISSAIDNGEFEPAATYWFGYYGDASKCVFENIAGTENDGYIIEDDEIVGLSGRDSGMAVSWNVNLEAGESRTYYALLGIGDATFKEKPKFTEEHIPEISEDGKISVIIENKIENKEDAGNLTLSVITNDGKELTVGDALLEDLIGQEEAPYIMTASFTDRQINARPGSYYVKTVRTTNKGGMFTDYVFGNEELPLTTVTLVPRDEVLDLRNVQPGFESHLYEGWEWNKENNELSLFGLTQESEEGIILSGGSNVIVEEEGAQIIVTGENKPAIYSEGALTVKAKDDTEGSLVIDAPVGIQADGNITIRTSMEINASETAIQLGEGKTLNVTDGAELTINLTSEDAVMFKTGEVEGIRVNVPKGYHVEGGTIDENGILTLDPGVQTLKFIYVEEVNVYLDYNGHGSAEVATMSVAKKNYIDRPEDPQEFGWSFQGWMTEAGEAWNFLTQAVENTMTLTAKWVKDATAEKTVGEKTVSTGIATMKASTELVPESQKEKEIVDELIANQTASTVPTSLKAAVSDDTYESIVADMEDGQKMIMGLNVDLIGCEFSEETETVSTLTIRYDVHPWYQIQENEEDEGVKVPISNSELNGKTISFRLPLPAAAADFEYVKLIHYLESGDEDLMYLPICTDTSGDQTEYYVNVRANQFSVFEMTFTNEKDEQEHITSMDDADGNWWSFSDKGWVLRNGSWYNIQNNGLVKGWFYEAEDSNWYYLDPETGVMKTGWVYLNDNWFYLNPENEKQSWFLGDDGKYHYGGEVAVKPLGALYTNCKTPDGYDVDETGAMVKFEEL